MRRIALTVAALATVVASLAAAPSFAGPDPKPTTPAAASSSGQAKAALATAIRVMRGHAKAGDPSPTIALTRLRLAVPALRGDDRAQAHALLARPTDGSGDPYGDGYTTKSSKVSCGKYVCVHWVTKTIDAPPAGWAATTLKQMGKVWAFEIGGLGYRKPLADGTRGGNAKLDVYLKEVGSKGYYGYCAPEKKVYHYTATGYCVLDDDFDPAQFGAPAINSLKVTAAHEFFHASQFAYDYSEDPWLMESTATWMEERYADSINDNRQYLPKSQVAKPETPLDIWVNGDVPQYGNWVWWEYLTARLGNGLVKSVWERCGSYKGAPDDYSTRALVKILKTKGTFAARFGAYASGNTVPGKFYSEGAAWGLAAPMAATFNLDPAASSGPQTINVDHLSSRNVQAVPGSTVTGTNQKLRIAVDGPDVAGLPVAVALVVKTDGTVVQTPVVLDATGVGTLDVPFDATTVASVNVTFANAGWQSVSGSCFQHLQDNTQYSCAGVPAYNAQTFGYTLTQVTV